jgi:hypothetical protein
MPTIQIAADQLLEAARQLPPSELNQLVERLLAWRGQLMNPAPRLSAAETALLLKINQGFAPAPQQRYDELLEKRDARALTPEEYQELLALTDQVEALNVERVQALADLARLRQVSLPEVMRQLGLDTPAYE